MSHRIQTRRGNGQYQRGTLGNCFGLANEVCGKCGKCHPYKVGIEKPPAKCESCGERFANRTDKENHE